MKKLLIILILFSGCTKKSEMNYKYTSDYKYTITMSDGYWYHTNSYKEDNGFYVFEYDGTGKTIRAPILSISRVMEN